MKKYAAVAAAALLTACSQPSQPQPVASPTPAASVTESGPCAAGFVEIARQRPACGIDLEWDGSLSIAGRRTAPIIVSYQEDASGRVAMPAREVILFPPSPRRGLRIVQACETADADGLCWAVRLLDPKSATLYEIAAGKYGPSHWIRWSPQESHAALVSRNEGTEWLHIVDTTSGTTVTYPDPSENADWRIDRRSFAWTGDDTFTMNLKPCESCASETRRFTLP